MPQSEQGPVCTDGALGSWTVIARQLRIQPDMSIADCRHELASLLGPQ